MIGKLRNFIPLAGFSALAGLALTVLLTFHHSPKHIQEKIYTSLLSDLPENVGIFKDRKPSLAGEIEGSYRYLRETCPAMARVDIQSPWNLAEWMNSKITREEWANSPYSFRINSFKAVSVQKNTDTKIELLGKLYNSIPSHPAFLVWVDAGKERFHQALFTDAYLNDEKKNWDLVVADDARLEKYMARVGEVFVKSFLNDQEDIKIPVAKISRQDENWQGQYFPDEYAVLYNFGAGRESIKNATHADKIAAHENFHAVEDIIKNWSITGKVAANLAFQDAGEKFFYGNHENLAHVSNAVNYEIYKNTFRERLAFYVMNAASPDALTLQTRDSDWKTAHPLNANGSFPDIGTLPAACRAN